MNDYQSFLASKTRVFEGTGIEVAPGALHPSLFGFQRDLVQWALRKGRAALFADTGLGKSRMQIEWARCIAERALMLAPLAVAQQTVREGEALGVEVTYARSMADSPSRGITITNYEMLKHFDVTAFPAVVLDESSILKAFSGTVKRELVELFRRTPYRLCCTATPAPNDVTELCNHADFLGIMTPNEMRSRFFTNKGFDAKAGEFRLKRHARVPFFRWLASWAMALSAPSDLGYPDDGFALPPLDVRPHFVDTDWRPDGHLFFTGLKGVTSRSQARRATVAERVAAAVRLAEEEPDEQWLLWAGLNDEARQAAAAIPGAVNVEGSDPPERKAEVLAAFAAGEVRVLVTKLTVAGYGLNFQRCARMAFVGLGDSWEQYYQGIRRCYRFGQTRPVRAFLVLSSVEADIYNNVMRKEAEASALRRELVKAVASYERSELDHSRHTDPYDPAQTMALPDWLRPVEVAEECVA